MTKGLYRTYNEALGCECARLDLGDTETEALVTPQRYAADGYMPAFEELPTKEEYLAQKG